MSVITSGQVPNMVKIAILRTTGDLHPNPNTVDPEASMSDFNFSFFNYSQLTARLDQIVIMFDPRLRISEEDIEDCDTVAECIGLVEKTIKSL